MTPMPVPDPHLVGTLLVIASDFDALGCTAHANVVRRAITRIEALEECLRTRLDEANNGEIADADAIAAALGGAS